MKSKNLKITLSVLILSLILSMFVLYTPVPIGINDDSFSAASAAEYIEVISREPHSVFDPIAHEDVRLYIKTQLEEFVGAASVFEMDYTSAELGEDTGYDIHNLLAVISGTSDTGILLVGHYDSRGHVGRDGELGRSYGAADDGYAVATLLEIARLYGNKNLTNSIYILVTDAEETGLYGALMASTEPFMDNIGFVINIEARGNEGPVYMFETSTNNEFIIDFYEKA
ncbi:MAG: M28 family peptidase, partial [Bacillota bacterium]